MSIRTLNITERIAARPTMTEEQFRLTLAEASRRFQARTIDRELSFMDWVQKNNALLYLEIRARDPGPINGAGPLTIPITQSLAPGSGAPFLQTPAAWILAGIAALYFLA
jgi:hypothetical protein